MPVPLYLCISALPCRPASCPRAASSRVQPESLASNPLEGLDFVSFPQSYQGVLVYALPARRAPPYYVSRFGPGELPPPHPSVFKGAGFSSFVEFLGNFSKVCAIVRGKRGQTSGPPPVWAVLM